MLLIVYYAFIIINSLIYVYKKESKFFGYISMIFVILFVAGKRYDGSAISYDLYNYIVRYTNAENLTNVEYGFKFINTLALRLGLSFESFYVCLTVICLILIFRTVIKLNGNVHLFCVGYMIYFILCPIDQLRNLCAFTCFFTAFPLINEKRKKHRIWLLTHIVAAGAFHITYLLYSIFLIVDISSIKKNYKPIFKMMLFTTIFVVATNTVSAVSNLVAKFLAFFMYLGDRYTRYTLTQVALGFLAPIAIATFAGFALYRWRHIHGIHSQDTSNNSEAILITNANTITNILLVSSCFFPLLLLNATSYRFIRDITLIVVAWLGVNSNEINITIKNRVEILMYVCGISIGWFIFDIVIKGYWIDYSEHFFKNVVLNF